MKAGRSIRRFADGKCGADAASRSRRAMGQSDIPGYEGDVSPPTEITVVDPRHPLYGRRFQLRGITHDRRVGSRVVVEYQPGISLTLPINMTSLRPFPVSGTFAGKLCVEGLRDLVAVAGSSEEACPSCPPKSGAVCRQCCVEKSPTNSPRSSGR